MKKLAILCVSMVLFVSLGFTFLHAEEPEGKTIDIEVTSIFDEVNRPTNTVSDVAYGSKLTLDGALGSEENYEFVHWVVNGKLRADLSIDHEFTVTNNMKIDAVFSPTDKNAVLFMDTNEGLLDTQHVVDDGTADDSEIDLPDKPGYEVAGDPWSGSLTNITEHTVLILQYVKTADDVTLEVVNGTGDGVFEYNETVTVEADAGDFSYWRIGNNIVSYQEEYTFTVLTDTTITAVFDEGAPHDGPYLGMQGPLDLPGREDHNSFVGQFHLPEDYELIEYGILTSSDTFITHFPADNYPYVGDGIEPHQGSKFVGETGEYLISVLDADSKYARAYAVVKSEGNGLETIYSQTEWDFSQDFSFVTSGDTSYTFSQQHTDEHGFEWDLYGTPGAAEGFGLGNASDGSYIEVLAYGGINTLSIDAVRLFTNSNTRSFEVFVNGESLGEFNVDVESDHLQTFDIDEIDVEGIFVLRIESTSPGDRGSFDIQNIKWDALGYPTSTDNFDYYLSQVLAPVSETEENLDLPLTHEALGYNLDIDWSSGNTDYITDEGVVTRPAPNEDDEIVTMTANVTNNGIDITLHFDVTVLAEPDITFNNTQFFVKADIPGSYGDGTYEGIIDWTYVHARDDAGYDIDGGGILLRRSDEPSSVEGTFENGLNDLYFEYRKAYTGATARTYEVHITHDGTTDEYTIPEFGSGSGEDETVHEFLLTDLGLEGEVTVKIVAVGPTGNQQAVFNNISWNEYND